MQSGEHIYATNHAAGVAAGAYCALDVGADSLAAFDAASLGAGLLRVGDTGGSFK